MTASVQKGIASLNGSVKRYAIMARPSSFFKLAAQARRRRNFDRRCRSQAVLNLLTRRLSINSGVFLLMWIIAG